MDLAGPPLEHGQAAQRGGNLRGDVLRLGRRTDHRAAIPPDVVVGPIAGVDRDLPVVTDAIDSKTAIGAAAEPVLGADAVDDRAEDSPAGAGREWHAPLRETRCLPGHGY